MVPVVNFCLARKEEVVLSNLFGVRTVHNPYFAFATKEERAIEDTADKSESMYRRGHEPEKEKTPEGIDHSTYRGRSYPIYTLDHRNTFEVEPSHNKVTTQDGLSGVSFNVETVPKALPDHQKKPAKTRSEVILSVQQTAANHYNKERNLSKRNFSGDRAIAEKVRIEAMSTSRENVVHAGSNGFVMALVTAFAEHLPLTLAPDHIWILISYAFAKHVDIHAEKLRKNFVQHEGKKRLEVVTPDSFAMSTGNNPDTGASATAWETLVFPGFSNQIKSYIGEKTHEAIAAKFSTTSPAAGAAHEITLMSAMKNYFSYGIMTMCGIPNITLLGTEEDWVALRSRTEKLGSLMMPDFTDYWMPSLLPVLDEFVESYRGNVNHGFWQSMVKHRRTGGGSGAYSFISGWMQIFFPYLASGRLNEGLKPWQQMYFYGPKMDQFPPICSSAPVDWDYHGAVFDLNFHAGIIGYTQDPADGTLSPLLGWYVSHVPPKSPLLQLNDYKKELNDLHLGHKEDLAAEVVDKNAPFYRRIAFLEEKIAELEKQTM